MLIALEFVKESIFIVKRMFGGKQSKCNSVSSNISAILSLKSFNRTLLGAVAVSCTWNFHSNDTPINFTYYTAMLLAVF